MILLMWAVSALGLSFVPLSMRALTNTLENGRSSTLRRFGKHWQEQEHASTHETQCTVTRNHAGDFHRSGLQLIQGYLGKGDGRIV